MKISDGSRFRLTRNWRGYGAVTFDSGADEDLRCVLPVDTVLVSIRDVDTSATGFLCVLEDWDLIREIVEPDLQKQEGFSGCRFMFFTGDVGSLLEAL